MSCPDLKTGSGVFIIIIKPHGNGIICPRLAAVNINQQPNAGFDGAVLGRRRGVRIARAIGATGGDGRHAVFC